MTVEEALKTRISVRAYLDTPVPLDTLRRLLDLARWAPSGGNLQPWRVIAVAGAEKDLVSTKAMEALAANPAGELGDYPIYPAGLQEPYRSRRFKVGEDMYALLGVPREDKAARLAWLSQNYAFFGAPVGLFFVIEKNMGHGQWAHLGMLMQSIALAAREMGLDTCMQEAWAMVRGTLHAHFSLGENDVVYCGMALGHRDPDAPVNRLRSDRAALEEIADFRGF